ncbi:MAG: hypothetical protein SGJ27_08870 [Candidatus Melainabacteria bacterium]|nr:hypothetical protein [Candidatus Melainabacteria bacterium]
MTPNSEHVLAHLEGNSQDERTEIAVRVSADSHNPVISIRQQAWGNGIGWFTQATVELPASSLTALKLALCLAPATLQRISFLPNANPSEAEEPPTVIPFPGLWSGTNTTKTTED